MADCISLPQVPELPPQCTMRSVSPYHSIHVDPRAGACVLVLFLAAALLMTEDPRMAALAVLPVIVAASTGNLRRLLRRLRIVIPMIFMLSVFVVLQSHGERVLFSCAGISIHHEAVLEGGWTGARLFLIAMASILYTLLFSIEQVTLALHKLRIPYRIVSIIWLAQRLVDILRGDADRTMNCMRARSAGLTLPARLRTSARISGTFLLRAVARSERLGDAMAVRGFTGSIPLHGTLRWRAVDTAILVVSILYFTVINAM